MTRILTVLLLLFLLFALLFAPAGLVRHLVPEDSGLTLAAPAGTLWNGHAEAVLGGRSAGRLNWRLDPVTFLQGALGYDVDLDGPGHRLSLVVQLSPRSTLTRLDGSARAAFLNQWLADYDIELSGDFRFEDISMRLPHRRGGDGTALAPGSASGKLTWTGGPLRYRLAGQDFRGELPPLEGYLGDGLEAVVYASGNETPLLRAQMLANGFVRLGMTKLLTRMLNNPWPGTDPDHEVVLEVEEQLL